MFVHTHKYQIVIHHGMECSASYNPKRMLSLALSPLYLLRVTAVVGLVVGSASAVALRVARPSRRAADEDGSRSRVPARQGGGCGATPCRKGAVRTAIPVQPHVFGGAFFEGLALTPVPCWYALCGRSGASIGAVSLYSPR